MTLITMFYEILKLLLLKKKLEFPFLNVKLFHKTNNLYFPRCLVSVFDILNEFLHFIISI